MLLQSPLAPVGPAYFILWVIFWYPQPIWFSQSFLPFFRVPQAPPVLDDVSSHQLLAEASLSTTGLGTYTMSIGEYH